MCLEHKYVRSLKTDKQMKMTDIKKKTAEDLKRLVSEKKEELRSFRFGLSGSKVKNIKEAKNTKKDIARILTVLSISGR